MSNYLEQEYTARIIATGAGSTVPDNETAVDAEISLGGKVVGEVTLIEDHTGHLSTWGQGLDHWADDAMRETLDGVEDSGQAIDEIVAAVRACNRKDIRESRLLARDLPDTIDITRRDITRLRTEAAQAGNEAQVELCDLALDYLATAETNDEARAECERAIRECRVPAED